MTQPFNPSKSTYQSILVKQYGYKEAKRLIQVAQNPLEGINTWRMNMREKNRIKKAV